MSEVKESYEILICGSTFLGLGMAFSGEDNVLLVERSSSVGAEFIDSLQPGNSWNEIEASSAVLELKKELIERNILSHNGKVHLPAIAAVLYERIKNKRPNVLLMTEIMNIEKKENYFEVTLFNSSGMKKVKAKKIIDTTSRCISMFKLNSKFEGKNLNAYIHSNYEKGLPNHIGVKFIEGRFDNEVIMCFPLEFEDTWVTARQKLHNFWVNRPEGLKYWHMDSVASEFDVVIGSTNIKLEDNWHWIASKSFKNPLAAYQYGNETFAYNYTASNYKGGI